MSEVTLNLQSYKASGVYFEEIDNSISTGTTNTALRLAVGYNEKGPFNRPIYLSSTTDCDEILGDVDRRLERKGCFTNRNIRTMVKTAPVYALNLLNPGDKTTGYCAVSFDSSCKNIDGNTMYKNLFDRSRFWVADADKMMDQITADTKEMKQTDDSSSVLRPNGALYGIGNCGTDDISFIVRKAEGLTGYNVTFLEWYGNKENIPYKWINPIDFVSDYFVQVIAVSGDYSDSSAFAADPTWKSYFDTTGIKKGMIDKFLRLDNVTVLGNWIGCIIPEFYDKQGKCKSIDYLINRTCNKTGLMFGINTDGLDNLKLNLINDNTEKSIAWYSIEDGDDDTANDISCFAVDTVTMNVVPAGENSVYDTNNTTIDFMSYNDIKLKDTVINISAKHSNTGNNAFTIEVEVTDSSTENSSTSTGKNDSSYIPVVGDYVRAADGTLTRIVKKRAVQETRKNENTDKTGATDEKEEDTSVIVYTFTTVATVKFDDSKKTVSPFPVDDDPNILNASIPNDEYNFGNIVEGQTNNKGQQYFMVFGEGVENDGNYTVEIHKNIINVYQNLKFIHIKGLKIDNSLRPGCDASGNTGHIEEGVEKIYSMLEDEGIKRGLLNNEMIDFRYIVDTLTGGLGEECGGKVYLAKLAKEKGHCTALINVPSITDFANCDAPIFYDGNASGAVFDAKYIAEGGNQDYGYTQAYEDFSLPTEDNGAKYAAVFSPYLKYTEGTKTFLVPPAADICNTFMQKYLGGDPYKTVANLNGVITSEFLSGLEYDFDKTDRGYLEPFGINPIISRGGTITIYGDRTCYQTVNSDFNFLHVRELLNSIELRCTEILKDYIYTYNNAATRAEIYNRIDPILKAMKDSGALAKYTIQVDENNNTKEIIDEKFCIVDIGVWVTPNMEKIVTRIKVNRGSEA